jgi:hypothetical protein
MSRSRLNNKPCRTWADSVLHALVVVASAVFATVILILAGEHAKGGWGWLLILAATWPISFGAFYLFVVFVSVAVNSLSARIARHSRATKH